VKQLKALCKSGAAELEEQLHDSRAEDISKLTQIFSRVEQFAQHVV